MPATLSTSFTPSLTSNDFKCFDDAVAAKKQALKELKTLQRTLSPVEHDSCVSWREGTAQLRDRTGAVRTLLRVCPSSYPEYKNEPTNYAHAEATSGPFQTLAKVALQLAECKDDRFMAYDGWPLPSTLTLDGDVLRTDRTVIARQPAWPDGDIVRWKLRPAPHRFPKEIDSGHAHVLDTTQWELPDLCRWLSWPGDTSAPVAAGLQASGARKQLVMGEVEIDTGLLARMGMRNGTAALDAPGAYRSLRFEPGKLEALLRRGQPHECITAIRLLKQMMRSGVPASDITRPIAGISRTAPAAALIEHLQALALGVDDDLRVSTEIWRAICGRPAESPGLPLGLIGKGSKGL